LSLESVEGCGKYFHVAEASGKKVTLQHAILYGEHELTIDDKNRMLVPAEIRKSLDAERDGEAFFVVIGRNRKVWMYPERYYEHLVSQRQQELTPDEDALAFDQYHFAMASRVEWDKQGRMLLPDKTLKRTGTTKEVTVIGARDHLELWNRADWDARFEELSRGR
jgi:MraZ protein